MMNVAHGVGTRSDLPVPAELAGAAAGAVLVGSFVVLAMLWQQPRLAGAVAGRDLAGPIGGLLDSTLLRAAARILATSIVMVVCVIGFAGPIEPDRNIAPWLLYVNFWAGLMLLSLVLGPLWHVLNPLRAIHGALAWILQVEPSRGIREVPAWLGLWPAAVSLAAFAWIELASSHASDPRLVATFICVYSGLHVTAATIFGSRWFEQGDGFEVYSSLLGSLAPIGRRSDGHLVARNPMDGLEAITPRPGLVGVVVVLVGTTAFDGLSRSTLWSDNVPTTPLWATAGLAVVIAVVAALYLAGTWRRDPIRVAGRLSIPTAFAHTLVPIAAGYAIAHYFSLVVFDGQKAFILASDPMDSGANLIGTADWTIDYTVVSTVTIAIVQLAVIVLGHVAAAVAAHERSLRLFPPRLALRIQYPMLASMVALTCGAVILVLAP